MRAAEFAARHATAVLAHVHTRMSEQPAGGRRWTGYPLGYPTEGGRGRVYAQPGALPATALEEQGFGVLTEIDVRATMREKLDAEVEPYVILGACNPPLAHRALEVDRTIGLLLPCNVVVRDRGGRTLVQALDPNVMTELTGRDELRPVAEDAAERLRAALDSLASSVTAEG
ncbi:hypothetical protein GCM10010492_53820 [Saccharothrix mutabilis subsp. mutabilis]|uniref:DUF302 domain-containing protein n=1 Tax=Saccharothrix mutabilis subsp. mutabilis TaxID=66855 RepID=A0ABN0UDX5_9PSEU